MDFNLYSLQVFVEVVRARSLTRAAAELGISQPAVSAQIKALEEKFGEQLLRRGVKETGLTAFGEEVHSQVLLVLAELDELSGLASGSSSKLVLTVGASSTPGTFWLPQKLKQLQQYHPSLECRYRLGDSRQVQSWVSDRSVVFGVVGELPQAEPERRGLKKLQIASDSLQLMAASGHRLAVRKRYKAGDFRAETLFIRGSGSSTRARSKSILASVLHQFGRIVELDNGEAIKEAVLAGLGLAVLSSWSVRREIHEGLVTAIDPKRWSQLRPIYLIRRASHPLRGQAALLWDYFTRSSTAKPTPDCP